MKTTGLISLIFVFFLTLNASGQLKSGIVVTFDSKEPVIKLENENAVATFKIKCTEKQINDIKATSLKFSKWSVTTVSDTKDAEGKYTLTIKSKKHGDNQKDKDFLLKLLYDFNIELFVYNGVGHEINKFSGIVK